MSCWRPPSLSPKPQNCSKRLQAFQQACKGSVGHSQIVTTETSLEAPCTPFTCQKFFDWYCMYGTYLPMMCNVSVTYSAEDKISLAALMKLNRCKGYEVLTALQKSPRKQEELKHKAQFSLSNRLLLSDLYANLQSAVKCITSWIDDRSATLSPTWNNFFHVLQEPGMDLGDMADKIQACLASTAGSMSLSDAIDTQPCSKLAAMGLLQSFHIHVYRNHC